MVSDLLKDSEDEEQTDVPPERSRPTSLNESEEERRTPSGEAQRLSPATSASVGPAMDASGRRSPPGLTLLSTQAPSPSNAWSFRCQNVAPFNESPSLQNLADESEDEEEGADDESVDGKLRTDAYPPAQPEPGSVPPMPGNMNAPMLDAATRQWYAELPSIGSANHFKGTCDRCCFHPKGRCLNGYNCQHCHFDHEKRKRKSKKIKDSDAYPEYGSGPSMPPHAPQNQIYTAIMPSPQEFVPPQQQPYASRLPAAQALPEIAEMDLRAAPSYNRWQDPQVGKPRDTAFPGPPMVDASFPVPESTARDDYIRYLEAENAQLRALLAQQGPGMAVSPAPNPNPSFGSAFLPHQTVTAPRSEAAPSTSSATQLPTFSTSTQTNAAPSSSSGINLFAGLPGLSAGAAPFQPGRFQSWSQPVGDASMRGGLGAGYPSRQSQEAPVAHGASSRQQAEVIYGGVGEHVFQQQ